MPRTAPIEETNTIGRAWLHHRQRGTSSQHRTAQVHVQRRVPCLGRVLLEAHGSRDADVVDESVDATELTLRGSDHLFDALRF